EHLLERDDRVRLRVVVDERVPARLEIHDHGGPLRVLPHLRALDVGRLLDLQAARNARQGVDHAAHVDLAHGLVLHVLRGHRRGAERDYGRGRKDGMTWTGGTHGILLDPTGDTDGHRPQCGVVHRTGNRGKRITERTFTLGNIWISG